MDSLPCFLKLSVLKKMLMWSRFFDKLKGLINFLFQFLCRSFLCYFCFSCVFFYVQFILIIIKYLDILFCCAIIFFSLLEMQEGIFLYVKFKKKKKELQMSTSVPMCSKTLLKKNTNLKCHYICILFFNCAKQVNPHF